MVVGFVVNLIRNGCTILLITMTTSDELPCPTCNEPARLRGFEPLCSCCKSCFECCDTLCKL